MILLAWRLFRVAITAEVRRDDGDLAREPRRELMPREMRERVPVQQQQRQAAAAMRHDDARAGGLDFGAGEAWHLHRRTPFVMRGHAPRIHRASHPMDCRVKFGNEDVAYSASIASSHFTIWSLTCVSR